jgi:GTP cyclohydrolase II
VRTLNQVVQGKDPQTAFAEIGLPTDARDYAVAAEILKALGVTGPVELLTNNPGKVKALQDAGIAIARQMDLYIEPKNPAVRHALEAKRDKEGHLLPSAIDIDPSPRR